MVLPRKQRGPRNGSNPGKSRASLSAAYSEDKDKDPGFSLPVVEVPASPGFFDPFRVPKEMV
jgi:hypothetical protein